MYKGFKRRGWWFSNFIYCIVNFLQCFTHAWQYVVEKPRHYSCASNCLEVVSWNIPGKLACRIYCLFHRATIGSLVCDEHTIIPNKLNTVPQLGTPGTIIAYSTAFVSQNRFIVSHILWEAGIAKEIDTRVRPGSRRSILCGEEGLFCLLKCAGWLRDPPRLPFSGYHGFCRI